MTIGDVQDHFHAHYTPRQPPRNPETFHCAIWPEQIERYRDNWKAIEAQFVAQDSRLASVGELPLNPPAMSDVVKARP